MRLKIRSVRLVAKTKKKTFGTEFNFNSNGLNIIRAGNSTGKSTVYNSILYAMGLEILIGTSKYAPLTYVLTRHIEDEGVSLSIEESYVMLEVENGDGKIKTIKRLIVPDERKNLVEVFDGPCISNPSHKPNSSDQYYAKIANSAKNERGFYFWFAKFIGWDLPRVERFVGEDTTLFLECIFPLFVVEQKKGWTQIQAGVPQYGIKNVKLKALEFVLKLDSEKINSQRRELANAISDLSEEWTESVRLIARELKQVNGTVSNIPNKPKVGFENDIEPIFRISQKDSILSLVEKIGEIESDIAKLETTMSGLTGQAKDEVHIRELRRSQDELFHLDNLERNISEKIGTHQTESLLLEKRIASLTDDIRQMYDAFKISQMTGEIQVIAKLANCPVCASSVDGSILSQDVQRHLMSVEENLEFLKDELKTVEYLRENNEREKALKVLEQDAIRETSVEVREKIRSLKESLMEDSRLPSEVFIREKIQLDMQLKKHRKIEENCDFEVQRLIGFSERYAELKSQIDLIPENYSESDNEKIFQLRDTLRDYLGNFGFESFTPTQLEISRETLQPVVEEFDWYFEASGSDNIRAIWAFTLALLSISKSFLTNHPGLAMFDEPRQHSARGPSLQAFLRKSATLCEGDGQVIITTSEPVDSLNTLLQGIPCRKFVFEDGQKLIVETK